MDARGLVSSGVPYYSDGNILSVLAFFIWIPVAYFGTLALASGQGDRSSLSGGLAPAPGARVLQASRASGLLEARDRPDLDSHLGSSLSPRAPSVRAQEPVVQSLRWDPRVRVGLHGLSQYRCVQRRPRDVPGHVPYDAVHAVLNALLGVVLPFYLGAVMFRTSRIFGSCSPRWWWRRSSTPLFSSSS